MSEPTFYQRIRNIAEWLDSKVEIGSSSFDLAPGPVSQFDFELSEAAHGLTMIAADLDRALAAPTEAKPEAEQVCMEAYQVVGSLLSDLGIFNTERARKILDNLSQAKRVHDDVLPWPSEAKPDCAGGIACTTCPGKLKCQRGCIRQGEALENPNRKDLRAECDAVDALLRGLGLEPERCRTEGGALNVGRTLSLLADGVKANPVAWGMRWQGHGPIMDCITPKEHESHEGEYTVPLFATPPTEAKPAQADALNTLCKMMHSGEEVEGDDGLAMLVPIDLWNEAQEAIELLVGDDEATEAKPSFMQEIEACKANPGPLGAQVQIGPLPEHTAKPAQQDAVKGQP